MSRLGGWSRVAAVALGLAGAAPARAAGPCDGPVATIAVPPSWMCQEGADPSAAQAAELVAPALSKPLIASAMVLVGSKRVTDLEGEASAWHAARLRNRGAWGVHASGGLPRELVRLGSGRAIRFRDRLGSSLGAREQTLTCTLVPEPGRGGGKRLACVSITAPESVRDQVDATAERLLGGVTVRR